MVASGVLVNVYFEINYSFEVRINIQVRFIMYLENLLTFYHYCDLSVDIVWDFEHHTFVLWHMCCLFLEGKDSTYAGAMQGLHLRKDAEGEWGGGL